MGQHTGPIRIDPLGMFTRSHALHGDEPVLQEQSLDDTRALRLPSVEQRTKRAVSFATAAGVLGALGVWAALSAVGSAGTGARHAGNAPPIRYPAVELPDETSRPGVSVTREQGPVVRVTLRATVTARQTVPGPTITVTRPRATATVTATQRAYRAVPGPTVTVTVMPTPAP